ncbi:MAG: ATP-dependent DNA ligase [Actinomycetota bacterium]|nr:ATP-dependent DNA ligase [Actinomycetota bacterium]
MLAKLQRELPLGDGWRYEPKWDGFRAIVFRDGEDLYVQSRDLRPLNRYFPELLPALADALPKRCVVDGEIVLPGRDGLDFDSLQMRLHPAESRVRKLAAETPVSFVAFDLLALGDRDLRGAAFADRRAELEKALDVASGVPQKDGTTVLLTPQLTDPEEAEAWFAELAPLGLEGVVAKRADLRYRPGERAMVKIKKVHTVDCVVGGFRPSKSGQGIGSLLLGLYDDAGVLHYVGHTSSFKARERVEIREKLRPLEGERSFSRAWPEAPQGRTPDSMSRWTVGREQQPWTEVKPVLVCEVSIDKMQGDRFRHAATFVRWRDDKRPEECTSDQL